MALTSFSSNTVISSSAVNANFSTLSDGTNDIANNSMATFRSESGVTFVASGLIIPTSVTLGATTAAGVAYIAGVRVAPGATAHTYTASKDTYVDLKNDGTYAYVEVANAATVGMTMTANAIRIAKVVTSGTAITSVQQYGVDSLSNNIYNTSVSSSPISTWVNTGNAGGTFYYRNQAGVKELWGATNSFSTSNATTNQVLNFPTSFFNVITAVSGTVIQLGTTANQYFAGNSGISSNTSYNFYVFCVSGTGTATVSLHVKGF